MGKFFLLLVIFLFLYPSTTSRPIRISEEQNICSASDIQIYQWPSGYGGLHVPQYTVQVVNEAWGAESVFDVHVCCGEFASATLVDPMVFRRISPNDCLVKNGDNLNRGETLSFQYKNILPYTLTVSQVRC